MSRKKRAAIKNISEISERLDVFANENKITLYRLAQILGVTHSYFSDLKRGRIAQGGIKFWDAIRREYPQWENYLRNTSQYPPTQAEKSKRSNSAQNNLMRLCILTRIEIAPEITWEEGLARLLKIDLSAVLTAVEEDHISDQLINAAAAIGYSPDQWLDKKVRSNNVELSFKKLAVLLKISVDKEWLYHLSQALKSDIAAIPMAILKNKIPGKLSELIEERGYPLELWWVPEEFNLTESPFVDLQKHNQKLQIAEKILQSDTKYAGLLRDYLDHLSQIMEMDKA